MSKYQEPAQVATHHDRRDDAAWFNRQVTAPAQQGEEIDTFVRESMTLTQPRSRGLQHNDSSVVAHRGRSRSRPRSASSRGSSRDGDRSRGGFSSYSRSRSRSRAHTPRDRALEIVEDNFTSSTTGIGASIIGAVLGGFVANRASEALQNRHGKEASGGRGGRGRYHDDHEEDANVPRIASTILGAVAGGLGANVLANHIEDQHDRSRDRNTWEKRYSREYYDYRRSNSRGRGRDNDEKEYDLVYDADEKYRRQRRNGDSGYRY